MGLAAYIVGAFGIPAAPSFSVLLGLRFAQGLGAAAIRVGILAAVRDRYSGAAMAEIMSVVMIIFLVIPMVMPGVGQVILLIGPWQLIFAAMGTVAVALAVWTSTRLARESGLRLSPTQRTLFRSMRDSEVSGQPISERLHELRHASVIGFLELRLVYRGSPISCGRPHWPLYAPNHRDAANVVPSPAVLEWPQTDIVYPHDQGAALRRHAARQGLGKLIR
jgi:MFS family permease